MQDIPDATGDGRHVLRLIAAAPVKYRQDDGTVATKPAGESMLDLEVTRVRKDGLMVWYKPHPLTYLDALNDPHPGWPYHDQVLVNEDGSRRWQSTLPGDTCLLSIPGRTLGPADFPDSDGNGRAQVRFYDFGQGDTVSLQARVALRRTISGVFAVTANTPFTLTLAGRTVESSPDGRMWATMNSSKAGGTVSVTVTDDILATGRIHLRIQP
jgi:hypothetical protein